MLQFSICRTTPTDDNFPEWDLNTEWKMRYLGNDRAVEIRRSVTSGEVLIAGTLTVQILKGASGTLEKEFARFMQSGSSFVEISFSELPYAVRYPKYHLSGLIKIFNVGEKCAGECKKCVHMKSLVELSNELEGMLDPQTCCFADVKLECGSESIYAHKSILSARSSVFAAMFKNQMKESHENKVDIRDMDVSVLRIMLTYIYTGEARDLTDSSASDLLLAADKYQLQDLKRVCCDFLKENLSLQNVLRILVLGDLHSEIDLKSSAVNYICNECAKFSDLEGTDEWKTVVTERPALAIEILTSVVKSRDDKKIMIHPKDEAW